VRWAGGRFCRVGCSVMPQIILEVLKTVNTCFIIQSLLHSRKPREEEESMSQTMRFFALRRTQTSQVTPQGQTMSKILIIATSLNPDSKSQQLAQIAFDQAKTLKLEADLLDLRNFTLPIAGTDAAWDDPIVQQLKNQMQQYNRFIFAIPIYNYDGNAAAKNLLELCGGSYLENAIAGFICAAGGKNSYMSALGMMNSLMLDFRVWIAPRFVYATDQDWTGKDWRDTKNLSTDLKKRLSNLLQDVASGTSK
jgi:NAD(P)H-dependent FMN reductase